MANSTLVVYKTSGHFGATDVHANDARFTTGWFCHQRFGRSVPVTGLLDKSFQSILRISSTVEVKASLQFHDSSSTMRIHGIKESALTFAGARAVEYACWEDK
jgi:hypothetical protein